MKISFIVDITDGELLNSPSISYIHKITSDIKRVKESDLFFAKTQDELNIAVQNGAFCIIFEKDLTINDNEIAYIKVKNIELAIIKIIRFKLSNKNLQSFYCNDISFDLLKIYRSNFDKNIYLFPKNIEKALEFIDEIEDEDIVFSRSKEVLNSIYPNSVEFEQNLNMKEIKNKISHSLFETSFSYKEQFFRRLKFSSLYIKDFLNLYIFFEKNSNKDFDFLKLKNSKNLKAIFLDKRFNILDFGKSNSFLIPQNNINLAKNEIDFMQKEYKYAKKLIFSKINLDFLEENRYFLIENINQIEEILKKSDFNCGYIVGFSYEDIFDYFFENQKSSTLF